MNRFSILHKSRCFLPVFAIAVILHVGFVAFAFGQGISISAKVSSLGLGLETTKSLSSLFHARLGVNYFAYGYEGQNVKGSIEYDLDVKMLSFPH